MVLIKPSKLALTSLATLLATLGPLSLAYAGLGAIKVLSSADEAFLAEIPLQVNGLNGNSILAGLADRNRSPLLSAYSPSAESLQFSVVYADNGQAKKILVKGPNSFSEPLLRFAVEMNWSAGRAVREFEVDYRRDGPRKPPPTPPKDDSKPAVHKADGQSRLEGLGVGSVKVLSRLGEPLQLELKLFGTALLAEQAPQVSLQALNSQTATQQLIAGIATELTKQSAGKYLLRLSTKQAVHEAHFAFRLQVATANAKVSRHYLVALNQRRSGKVVQTNEQGKALPHLARKSNWPSYRVLKGDTLFGIAQRIQGGGPPRQVLNQLLRSNPEAFVQGNADKLLAGAVLQYPAHWQGLEAAKPVVADAIAKKEAKLTPPTATDLALAKEAERAKQVLLQKQEAALQKIEQRAKALEQKTASEPSVAKKVIASASASAASAPVTAPLVVAPALAIASSQPSPLPATVAEAASDPIYSKELALRTEDRGEELSARQEDEAWLEQLWVALNYDQNRLPLSGALAGSALGLAAWVLRRRQQQRLAQQNQTQGKGQGDKDRANALKQEQQ